MAKSPVELGQKVFVLSPQGEVVRTMVGQLRRVQCYEGGDWVWRDDHTFLNGDGVSQQNWSSFEAAAQAAQKVLEARRAALRKQLRTLAARVRHLKTAAYRQGVESAPYKMVDLGDGETRIRTRMRKRIAVPDTYFKPGQVVYAIITPLTPPHGSQWADSIYRPHSHFVLETEVRSATLAPDGTARYTFATPLRPEELFLTREEATQRLQSYCEPGTLEPTLFVSMAEEKEKLDELLEDDVPF
jgi:hypothetical protein